MLHRAHANKQKAPPARIAQNPQPAALGEDVVLRVVPGGALYLTSA
jgi:hypothetical protein